MFMHGPEIFGQRGNVFFAVTKPRQTKTNDIDAIKQVFSKIYFSIRNFDFRSSLLTWIYKITVNECYDYLRKKRVRKLVYESDFSEEDAQRMQNTDSAIQQGPAVDTQLAQRDLVLKLLAKLSQDDRMLLLMKEVEGHSVEELSRMTGTNENTIKVKLFRARQKLLKAAQRLNRGSQSPLGGAQSGF